MSSSLYQSMLGTAATRTKPRPSIFKRFRRMVVRAGCLQTIFLCGAATNAYVATDPSFRLQHHNAIAQDVAPSTPGSSVVDALAFWRWSIWGAANRRRRGRVVGDVPRHLAPGELECVQVIASLWSFDLHPAVVAKLAPLVEMYDPWFTLRGSLELRDAWYFASCLCDKATPKITKVARSSVPGQSNDFFIDLETTVALRMIPVEFTLPSTVKLTLDDVGKGRRRVQRIEHRWFGDGPIPGTLSYSDNFVARWADGLRHLDGFAMSVLVSTERMFERYNAPAPEQATDEAKS